MLLSTNGASGDLRAVPAGAGARLLACLGGARTSRLRGRTRTLAAPWARARAASHREARCGKKVAEVVAVARAARNAKEAALNGRADQSARNLQARRTERAAVGPISHTCQNPQQATSG
jgi:hypothetical protein